MVCAYRCDWNDDVTFDDAHYARTALKKLVPNLDAGAMDAFEKLLRPTDFEEVMESETAKVFAQVVGLEHYDWLDYDHVARDFRDVVEVR